MAQKKVSKKVFKALNNIGYSDSSLLFFLRPTMADVVEWFRENGINIFVHFSTPERKWTPWVEVESIDNVGTFYYVLNGNTSEFSNDYYIALENGIIRAIEYIKQKKIIK